MNEVHDPPVFGEERLEPVQEGDGGRVDGVEPEKTGFLHREGGEVTLQGMKDLPDFLPGPFPLADEPVGDQFLDVRPPQGDPDRVAVFDLVESVLVDLPGLFDPLLERGDDPERKGRGFLPQVLEEADVFIEGVRIGLGPKKFGELIHQKDQP